MIDNKQAANLLNLKESLPNVAYDSLSRRYRS